MSVGDALTRIADLSCYESGDKLADSLLEAVPLLVAVARAAEHSIDKAKVCALCDEPVIYSDGYWIHRGFGEVDGKNGLFCTPEMWDVPSRERVYPYARGSERDIRAALAAVERYATEHLPEGKS